MVPSSSNWVDTPEFDLQKVIGKLTFGRDVAGQLRGMLQEITTGSVGPAQAQGMVGQILDTFTQSLMMLSDGGADSDEVSQVPAGTKALSRQKMEDSGDSCKTPPAPKDQRGRYKRRRTEETRIEETPNSFEDGHGWRKYGQKNILKSNHPRNYFRCTHKFDQGCLATKHVQKIQDDPPLIRTTYHGRHTCANLNIKSAHHEIIMDAAAPDSSIIWSFSQSGEPDDHKPDTPMVINPVVLNAPTKQENKWEPPHQDRDHDHDHQQQIHESSNSPFYDHGDCFFRADELTTLDTSDHDVISSGGLSCCASNHNGMDFDHLDQILILDSRAY